ncbi:MAG: pyridoxamine 5'-phosphate oxidase family protein [Actinomycetota bacterium]|nr:pyridoxamine 5'-phosphate oxidase family protein [Actinomycetota bacterium]
MSTPELDDYLRAARTCRVATVGPDGPHVAPLWFAWLDGCLWLYSIVRSQRWTDLTRDPRVGAVVDDGHDYGQLRGVEISGTARVVGEVPRTGEPSDELAEPERAFARKYQGYDHMDLDGRHGWLRVSPNKIASWDFRKLGS